MNFVIRVKRAAGPGAPVFWQEFAYEGDESESVAAALRELNARAPLTDLNGREAPPIRWECGCACGKCGACAMRVNGLPMLACKAFLGPLGHTVALEPLSKFPLVADLVVDRSVIFEQLKKIHLWLSGKAVMREKGHELRFQSARCLMCGCCLEICPNFSAEGGFAGALAAVNAYRMFNQESDEPRRAEAAKRYVKHYYAGCGTSLACRDICPAGIPVDELISRSNAAAVWRRRS
ncbi:MAG: 2Fe-2S iron-sulfur cluster-binding protein [Pyramidobacter sp.]|uniref:succinate dehydrogenase/fumarate reductase iron-sulfur subunit n=1 Tax=Pyramidobacter sp. TaxID=1943581 RepID=UPI002A7FE883|nr:2Fe-2S iron-sulfur cluster-binding protein [Pyramidobacter sp.]MDY4032291.1 2Fe-2S iron-sulfur cluster-binding protein [Pyramidobacter sp.]